MAQKPTDEKSTIKDLPQTSKDKPLKDEYLTKVIGGTKPSIG